MVILVKEKDYGVSTCPECYGKAFIHVADWVDYPSTDGSFVRYVPKYGEEMYCENNCTLAADDREGIIEDIKEYVRLDKEEW